MIADQSPKIKPTRLPRSNPAQRPSSTGPVNGHAAGAVLAETVVGPALFWSIAALQCADVVAEWGRLTKMLNNVQHTIRLAGGSIMATVGALSAPQQHPLPSGGYEYDPPP